jgi:hypothetical protein
VSVGRVYSNISPVHADVFELLLNQKERQLEKARKALMMCVAPDAEAERLKEEVLLEQ